MNVVTLVAALGAILVTIATAVIAQPKWPAWLKRAVTGLIAALYAIVVMVIQGEISEVPEAFRVLLIRWLTYAVIAYGMSQAWFLLLKKRIKQLEASTSPTQVEAVIPERTPEQLSREIAAARAKVQASMVVNPRRLDPDDLYAAVSGTGRARQHAPKHALRSGATAIPHGPDNASADPDAD